MSLAALKVFDQHLRGRFIEMLTYQIDLFNEATRGGITLINGMTEGNYVDETFWENVIMTRRRNANAETAISDVTPEQDLITSVKVDAGTPRVVWQPSHLLRILENPELQGQIAAEHLAQQRFADMLNVGLVAFCAATAAQSELYTDFSGTEPAAASSLPTWDNLAQLQQKMGDASEKIACWVMPSASRTRLLRLNLANAVSLFTYGTVNVYTDAQGRPIIVSDHPALSIAGPPADVLVPGLVPGGIKITANNDFLSASEQVLGYEQIRYGWQAEWSFTLGLKGYTWDKTTGATSPSNAALGTAGNWDKKFASHKDLAGVLGRFNL